MTRPACSLGSTCMMCNSEAGHEPVINGAGIVCRGDADSDRVSGPPLPTLDVRPRYVRAPVSVMRNGCRCKKSRISCRPHTLFIALKPQEYNFQTDSIVPPTSPPSPGGSLPPCPCPEYRVTRYSILVRKEPLPCRSRSNLTAVFRKVPEGFIGFVEELPGANTQGKTLDETRRNLERSDLLGARSESGPGRRGFGRSRSHPRANHRCLMKRCGLSLLVQVPNPSHPAGCFVCQSVAC